MSVLKFSLSTLFDASDTASAVSVMLEDEISWAGQYADPHFDISTGPDSSSVLPEERTKIWNYIVGVLLFCQISHTWSADDVSQDSITLEEKEENAKELDHNRLRVWSIEASKPVCYLGKIGTLSWPHGCSTHSQDKRSRKQGVKLWIELSSYVCRIAENAKNKSPLNLQVLDQDARHKHTGEDKTCIDASICPSA